MQKLLLTGLLILFVGVGLIIAGTATQGASSTGGVIFIGPFPIVFGSGPGDTTLALVSVIIGGVMVALLLLTGKSAHANP